MKKVLFLGAYIAFMLFFTGCGGQEAGGEYNVANEKKSYQEEVVTLPEDISSEAVLRLYQEENEIHLGAFLEDETSKWYEIAENEEFKEIKEEWLDVNERGSVIDCFSPEKGKRYVLRRKLGKTGSYSIELWENGVSVSVLDLQISSKVYLERIYGDKEETVLLFSAQEGYIFKAGEKSGKKITVAGGCGYYPLKDKKLIAATGMGSDYGVLNLQSGKFEEIFSPKEIFQKNTLLSAQLAKGENNWYFLTSQGIYVLKEEAAELLVEAEKTSIFLSDFYANSMVCEKNENFLVCTGEKIYRYRWKKENFTKKKQLTITSCEELPALRDAVVKFNLQNQDTELSYNTLLPANYTAQEKADAVRNLNTQIMAGDGSDIFVLNGLPLESYEKKGLLLDLKEELKDILQEENFYGKVISGYEQDGKLFAPVFSFVPLLHLIKEDGCSPDSLGEIATWLKTNDKSVGFSTKFYNEPNREFFRKTVYQFYQKELKQENEKLEKESIRTYLETEKLLYDRMLQSGKAAEDDVSRGIPLLHDVLYSLMRKEDGDFGCLIGLERELLQNVNPFREKGWNYQVRKQYIPGLVAGVSSQSKNPEEAKAFIRFLFDKEIQSVLGNGYEVPVYKNSLKSNWEKIMENYRETYGEQYEMKAFPGLPVYVITEKEISSYMELFERAEQPVEYLFGSRNSEPEEFKLFYERSEEYFDGTKQLEETVEDVYRGLQTLEAERE